jgi:hypothetical protein
MPTPRDILPTYDELMRLSRRHFLGTSALGLGALALGDIIGPRVASAATTTPGDTQPALPATHFPAKAKRVIYLFQSGGPSHLETLDPKPKLREMHGQPLPDSVRAGQRLTGMSGYQAVLPIAGSFTLQSGRLWPTTLCITMLPVAVGCICEASFGIMQRRRLAQRRSCALS